MCGWRVPRSDSSVRRKSRPIRTATRRIGLSLDPGRVARLARMNGKAVRRFPWSSRLHDGAAARASRDAHHSPPQAVAACHERPDAHGCKPDRRQARTQLCARRRRHPPVLDRATAQRAARYVRAELRRLRDLTGESDAEALAAAELADRLIELIRLGK